MIYKRFLYLIKLHKMAYLKENKNRFFYCNMLATFIDDNFLGYLQFNLNKNGVKLLYIYIEVARLNHRRCTLYMATPFC